MNIKRAILTGISIWAAAFALVMISHFVPVLENATTQENLVLMVAVVPISIFGAYMYFKKDNTSNGLSVGVVAFSAAGLMDALVTVPLLVLPLGGTYADFFFSPIFWIVISEGILTFVTYRKWHVSTQKVYQS